jgi:hypothetical protein
MMPNKCIKYASVGRATRKQLCYWQCWALQKET